jgi:hypothetical protein
MVPTIDALNGKGRLAPVATGQPSGWERLVSEHNLGDPASVAESWRLRAPKALA